MDRVTFQEIKQKVPAAYDLYKTVLDYMTVDGRKHVNERHTFWESEVKPRIASLVGTQAMCEDARMCSMAAYNALYFSLLYVMFSPDELTNL